jgi:hypothetical protein
MRGILPKSFDSSRARALIPQVKSNRSFLLDAKQIEKLLGYSSQLLGTRIIWVRHELSQTPIRPASTRGAWPRCRTATLILEGRIVAARNRLSLLRVVHHGKHSYFFIDLSLHEFRKESKAILKIKEKNCASRPYLIVNRLSHDRPIRLTERRPLLRS